MKRIIGRWLSSKKDREVRWVGDSNNCASIELERMETDAQRFHPLRGKLDKVLSPTQYTSNKKDVLI